MSPAATCPIIVLLNSRSSLNFYDLCYAAAVGVSAPYWLIKSSARRRVLAAFRERLGDVQERVGEEPAILVHAVSVGEVNSTPALINVLKCSRPELRFIVSTTTQTGFDRSRQLYADGSDVRLIRFPLDFTPAIVGVLDRLRPAVIVLMELEVWPNLMRQCQKRSIPVIVANGRITRPAMSRYRLAGPITRLMFRRLAAAAVQDETYASRFQMLGVPGEKLQVLGTMKFDSATVTDRVEGDAQVAQSVGLRPGEEKVWVCGSTGPGEEQIVLEAYRTLLTDHPTLRLVIVPRHPPRFDDVAKLVESAGFALIRRSCPNPPAGNPRPVILGDTMGELRKFYSLADVVFVGRSLVDLGPRQAGSDMIEPAALGKPVIVGPHTGNFDMPMRLLLAANGVIQINDPRDLARHTDRLLRDESERRRMGTAAQQAVRNGQGSTARHAALILQHLGM